MESIFRINPFLINVRAARVSFRRVIPRVHREPGCHLARRRRVTSYMFQRFDLEAATPWIVTFLILDEDAIMDLRFSFMARAFLASCGHGDQISDEDGSGAFDGIRMRRFVDFAYGPFEDLFEKVDVDDGFWD